MKVLVFDSGPIISLSMTNLLWMLRALKERFGGEFYISHFVREEIVDTPLRSRKFRLEALQVEEKIRDGVLKEVHEDDIAKITNRLMGIANSLYYANGRPLTLVQFGEMSTIALACRMRADAIVVDERTTREIMEDPVDLCKRLSRRFNANVTLDREKLAEWKRSVCDIPVLRSAELAVMAYEAGLLDRYLMHPTHGIPDPQRNLLDAVLWGIKLSGCAIAEKEINTILKLEK